MRCRRCGGLLLAGNYADGTRAARDAFGGGGGGSGRPQRVDPYQPAGDLYLEFLTRGPIGDYHRELDLETASATVSYLTGGRRFTRQYVAHLVEDLILVRVTHAGLPFDCVAWLDRTYDADCELTFDTDAAGAGEARLTLDGRIRDGVDFRVQGGVWCRGGRRRVIDGRKLLCEAVTEAVFAVDIGVSAFGRSAAEECAARRLREPGAWDAGAWDAGAWDDLFRAHVREHERHYGSMQLELALEAPDLPTDERIRRVRGGAAGSRPAAAVLPLRALPAVRLFRQRRAAGEPAGQVERGPAAAVGQRLPPRRQPADELLDRRAVRHAALRGGAAASRRAAGAACPQGGHGPVWLPGCLVPHPDRRLGPFDARVLRLGGVDRGRPLAGAAPVVALRIRARCRLPAHPRLSLLQGGGRVLRGLPGRR